MFAGFARRPIAQQLIFATIAALIAVAIITTVSAVGSGLNTTFTTVATKLGWVAAP